MSLFWFSLFSLPLCQDFGRFFLNPHSKIRDSAQGTKSSAFVPWTSSRIFSGGYNLIFSKHILKFPKLKVEFVDISSITSTYREEISILQKYYGNHAEPGKEHNRKFNFGFKFITPRENPRRGLRYKSGAFSTLGRSLGFSSGGLKRNGQNPDTMEAKTVKTKIKTQIGKKWLKSAISCDNFERL